jgi:hypothetical protein
VGELKYLADNPGKLLVARLRALDKPSKQILILAQHQLLKALAIRSTKPGVPSGYKWFQHQIKLQHATPGGPSHSTQFFAFNHTTNTVSTNHQSCAVYPLIRSSGGSADTGKDKAYDGLLDN